MNSTYKIINTNEKFYTEGNQRGIHIYPISTSRYSYYDEHRIIKSLRLDENFLSQKTIMVKDLIDFLFNNGYNNGIECIDSNNTIVNLV